MALTNLVSAFVGIGLIGVIREMISQYVKLRDFVLLPLAHVLQVISIPFPSIAKDIVVLYLIMASSMYYAGAFRFADDLEVFQNDASELEREIRAGATAAGRNPDKLWAKVKFGLEHRVSFYFVRNVISALAWPQKLARNVRQVRAGSYEEVRMLKVFLLRLLAVVAATSVFFLWNYANSL